MDEGEPCEIVHTGDHAGRFQFRVRHSAIKDLGAGHHTVRASTIVAGCRWDVYCYPRLITDWILLSVVARTRSNPALELAAAKVVADVVLLDRTGSPASTAQGSTDFTESFWSWCHSVWARRDDVEANCVRDDGYFVALCSVGIVGDWPPVPHELADLGHDLAKMWDEQQLTDVSFAVDGETIGAHRLVLAARSPVFRAELYGPMAESKMASITVDDMSASTFRSMLHCMYHGTLPPPSAAANETDGYTMAEYQHLLVAADRYGVEALKQICEEKLCDGVALDTVVSDMELAEQHTCPRLKARCLDFFMDDRHLKTVACSYEFRVLMRSFPSLMAEVLDRLALLSVILVL